MKTLLNGIHAVQSALESDPDNVLQVWVADSKRNQRVVNLAQQIQARGLVLHKASMNQLDKLAKSRKHQGIVAEYNAPKAWDDSELFDLLNKLEVPALLLILDGVTDPHNLGACLRTAEGAGVHAVIAPKDKAAGLTPTARKVASGAAETIPFVQVTNLVRTIDLLKDAVVWITGTSDKATEALYAGDYKTATALVMGAEGKGLRRLTEAHCDHLISIPIAGNVSSLNVSVAKVGCLYEVVRQRLF
jgi:23S rRNA (guanosine2251-2'-O)-methyltransferase